MLMAGQKWSWLSWACTWTTNCDEPANHDESRNVEAAPVSNQLLVVVVVVDNNSHQQWMLSDAHLCTTNSTMNCRPLRRSSNFQVCALAARKVKWTSNDLIGNCYCCVSATSLRFVSQIAAHSFQFVSCVKLHYWQLPELVDFIEQQHSGEDHLFAAAAILLLTWQQNQISE